MARRIAAASQASLPAASAVGPAELVLLDDVRFFDDNLKAKLGKDFAAGLDASVEDAGFSGSMVLTPRCDEVHAPELAAAYGSDGRYIVADGNARLERIQALGYRWLLVLPQPPEDDATGVASTLRAVLEAGEALLEKLASKVRGNEKIAFGRVNPRLATPDRVLRFVLGYDRNRAKYDENLVQTAIEDLIKRAPEQRALVWTLAVQKQSAIKQVLDQEKQRERAAKEAADAEAKAKAELELAEAQRAARAKSGQEPGADHVPDEAPEPTLSPEAQKAAAKKKLREDAVRFPFLFQFTKLGAQLFDECLRRVQTSMVQPGREGRLLSLMELAVEVLSPDELKSTITEACVEVVSRHLKMLDAERAEKAKAAPAK